MPNSIFAYIFKYSKRQQILVFIGTLIYLPILYMSFELPKIIVNDALDADPTSFPRTILDHSFDQLPYLFTLCGVLLALVLITGGLRYVMSVYKGVLGKIMLRRLRYDLYTRILQFPLSHLKKVQGGEIVTMATAEAEPLGRFMGVAVANPTLQGGTMLTALVFLFAQDWLLGIAAISLFPVQAYLVPKLQVRMNMWSRKRLANVRLFAGHITETMDGYRDIHAHDTTAYELAKASQRLGVLFRIRRSLYKIGNGIIFLNNFFTQLTPFLFYVIGGYLVVTGDLSLGALVAVIAAYRETAAPWNDLLEYYQSLEDNRVKYAALVENFSPEGLREIPDCHRPEAPGERTKFEGELSVANVTVKEGEEPLLESVSISAPLPGRVAILGPAGSGKVELAQLLCALRRPSAGGINIAGQDLSEVSEVTLGRCVSYLDQSSHVFTGTWRDNIYYGLKHRPVRDAEGSDAAERALLVSEAREAGNTVNDLNADWVDFEDAGFDSRQALDAEAVRMVRTVGLADAVFEAGMREPIDPALCPELADKLLRARSRFAALLGETDFADAVEFFHADKFNTNASVMENLLFGELRGAELDHRSLAADAAVRKLLADNGVLETLEEIGHIATSNILEMFRDLPAGDERLSRFSVIDPDDMPAFESLLRRVPKLEGATVAEADRAKLLSVALQLTPAQHRLGLIDNRLQVKLVAVRKALLASPPPLLEGKLAVNDPAQITAGAAVRSNILFGRLSRHRAQHRDEVEDVMARVIAELELEESIIELGLDASVGVAGGRLAAAQKQKLALARCLIKRPQILIVNEALAALEPAEQDALLETIVSERPEGALIWIDRERERLEHFHRVYVMRGGRVVEERGADGRPVVSAAVEAEAAAPALPVGSFGDDVQVLDDVPMLSGLSPETLKLIAFTADYLEFEGGEILFREGDAADDTFIITEGAAEIIIGEGETERVINTHGAGTLVGELALLSDSPRVATVRALGELKVLRLTRDLFFDLVSRDANLGLAVMRSLSDRLVMATHQLEAAE